MRGREGGEMEKKSEGGEWGGTDSCNLERECGEKNGVKYKEEERM